MAYANIISKHIAEIRAARNHSLYNARIEAIKERNYRAAVVANLAQFCNDIAQIAQAEMEKHSFSTLESLTIGDYQKWLRKTIRENGRRAEVGTVQHSPVDMFLKERTGLDCTLLAWDEIEVTVNGETHHFDSAPAFGYYIYSDEGEMIVTAGKALDVATWFDASTLIVA